VSTIEIYGAAPEQFPVVGTDDVCCEYSQSCLTASDILLQLTRQRQISPAQWRLKAMQKAAGALVTPPSTFF
jgi:hypothetical protein